MVRKRLLDLRHADFSCIIHSQRHAFSAQERMQAAYVEPCRIQTLLLPGLRAIPGQELCTTGPLEAAHEGHPWNQSRSVVQST